MSSETPAPEVAQKEVAVPAPAGPKVEPTKHCMFFAKDACSKAAAAAAAKRKSDSEAEGVAKRARPALTDDQRRQRFKTKECKFFGKGLCTKGDRCPYIHGMPPYGAGMGAMMHMGGGMHAPPAMPHDASLPPPPWMRPFNPMMAPPPPQAGRAPIDMNRYKTKTCRFFSEGKCTRGEMCTFLHTGEAANPTPPPRLPYGGAALYGQQPPPQFGGFVPPGNGFFASGEAGEQPYKYKTQMCKFFSEGKCQRGDNCTYSHGEPQPAPAGITRALPVVPAMNTDFQRPMGSWENADANMVPNAGYPAQMAAPIQYSAGAAPPAMYDPSQAGYAGASAGPYGY